MIELAGVERIWRTDGREVRALAGVDFTVRQGEFVDVRGASGSGKTTLLLAIGGMLRPSGGSVVVKGEDLYMMTAKARNAFRAAHVGFVFQMFHLVPYLTVLENVLLARGAAPERDGADPRDLLNRLGLDHRVGHRPAQLSAGERQRAAVARALVNRPSLVLADEPTGNLDPENAAQVRRHLEEYHREGGTVLVVTHSDAFEASSDRTVRLESGRIVG